MEQEFNVQNENSLENEMQKMASELESEKKNIEIQKNYLKEQQTEVENLRKEIDAAKKGKGGKKDLVGFKYLSN